MKALHMFAALVACSLIFTSLQADNSTQAGAFTIHHNAITTDTLVPSVAKQYGITRSPNRGLINISVVQKIAGTIGSSVTADVKVRALRLSGQQEDIYLHEIREQGAIYYIGTFGILNGEKIIFQISAKPAGSEQRHETQIEQEFFLP